MNKYTSTILSSRDSNEYDRIYFLYTREAGLVRAIGRGVRKPAARLAGHLEPGTLAEVYVARSRGMGQITGAIAVSDFQNARKDFQKLAEFLRIAEFFVKNFSEDEKDERIFDLISGFMRILNEADNADLAREAFWWKLFDFLGKKPEVMKCARCGAKLEERNRKFFSAARGGVICKKCRGAESGWQGISSNQIKLLRIFFANPIAKIAKVKVDGKEIEGLRRMREEFERYNF